MPDLTAADLYEMVKDWPLNARPDDLWYWPDQGYWNNDSAERRTDVDVGSMPVSHAIALHEASGLRWLVGQNVELLGMGPIVHVHQHGDEWWVYCKDFDGKGPSLLHAIDAAIKGVG